MLTTHFFFTLAYQLYIYKCISAACGRPPEVNNAKNINEKIIYEPGEKVIYSCILGYTGIGHNNIVCPKNGIWAKPNFNCKPRTCTIPKMLENGEMQATEFTFGKHIYYNCNEGFILRGKGNSTCQADGTWSDQQQSCEPVSCLPPTAPINGKLKLQPTGRFDGISVFGDVVTYECNQGLALIGNETGFCLANGKWSNAPQCKEVKCPRPPKIPNGFTDFHLKIIYNFGDTVEYGCIANYILDGARQITCQKTAHWTDLPSCRAPCIINVKRGRIFYNAKKIWLEDLQHRRILHGEVVAFYCLNKLRKCGYQVLTQCNNGRVEIPSCFEEPTRWTYTVSYRSLPSEIQQC